MGNEVCRECHRPQAPITSNIHLDHPNGPDYSYAYPQQIKYEVPCEVNHLLTDLLPINYQPYALEGDHSKQEDLMGEKIPQSFFIVPYSVYYTGQWKNGKPHGIGEVVFASGGVLNGTFYHGSVRGRKCIYISKDGAYYLGGIENNNFKGKGIYKEQNGHFYEGQWQNNVPDGKGEQIFENGDRYVGGYLNGEKYGNNEIYVWKNHQYYQKYEGSFEKNYFSGYGTITLKDGTSIQGLFREGSISQAYLKNQYYQYEGMITEGKMQGKGKIKFIKENKSYEGEFKDGQMHGIGTLTDEKGKETVGTWFKGTHIHKMNNLTEEQTQKIIQTVNNVFSKNKYIQEAIEILDQGIREWSKQHKNTEYSVKQMSKEQANKINSPKYCVVQISNTLIGIIS